MLYKQDHEISSKAGLDRIIANQTGKAVYNFKNPLEMRDPGEQVNDKTRQVSPL